MSAREPDAALRLRLLFARIAAGAAALTFVVIVASAFMRHTQVGLACADWPACYGVFDAATDGVVPAGVRIARILHRIAATGVLALVIGLLLIAWTQQPPWKKEGLLALGALILAAALAILGIATPGARLPAVTLGNLLGGYLMLATLSAMAACGASAPAQGWAQRAPLALLALAVLALMLLQSALGASIGAQYAVTACPTLGKCPGFPFDEFRMTAALDPFRPLTIEGGHVVPPRDAAGIFLIHRALGIVVAAVVFVLAIALRHDDRRIARTLAALAIAAPLAGVAAIAALPSLALTVLHNSCSALLVAALAVATQRPVPQPANAAS
jgi:cytochrome c oxidase assembly protein subunit 15